LSRRIAALRLADRGSEVTGLLNPWVDDFPEHIPGRLALAGILQEQGLNEDALMHYEYVLGRDRNSVVALNNAAWLYNEDQRPEALSLAQRAERLAPDNPAVLDTLGWILAGQERYGEAMVFAEKAAQLAPQSPEIRYHAALVQARVGRSGEARAALEALLAEYPAFSGRNEAVALLDSL
jgi:tetratricopeptide (TPR) repeat protein